MEKKKKILIILVIIVLLVSISCVCLMFFKNNENLKNEANEKVENNVSKNEEVEELENVIENEINVEDEEMLDIGISKKEKEELEEKAKDILSKYISLSYYEADNLGAMPYILVELELINDEELNEQLIFGEEYVKKHIKTTVKYDDFKNAMLNYITEEYFNKYFCLYKNIDGYVGVNNTAAGLGASEVEEMELVKIDNEKYEFEAKLKDVETYEHFVSGDTYVKEGDWTFYKDVTFTYENGKFVISKYSEYIPYLDGIYAYEASDVGYEFYTDGTVKCFGNMSEDKGTYIAIAPNTFEITFTERTISEEDYENAYIDENGYEVTPFKEVVSEINETQTITIVDEENLIVEYEVDGENYKGELIKFERED